MDETARPLAPSIRFYTRFVPFYTRFLALAFAVVVCGLSARAAAGESECIHTVAKGDTLSKIALRNGVSEADLVATDPALKMNRDLLRIGQKLDICAARKHAAGSAKTKKARGGTAPKGARPRRCGKGGVITGYEVRKGDTLSRIAHDHGVTEAEIVARNSSLKGRPDHLKVGQALEICVEERRITKSKLCDYETPLFEHEVVPGEHLGQIAGRYGVRRSDLFRWNSSLAKSPDRLRVGERIRVCPAISPRERHRILYTVNAGDTVYSIAKAHDLTPREVERFQQGKLPDPNALEVGQRLVLWVDGGIVPGFAGADSDSGTLVAGVQLPEGRHYHVKWKAAAWGTERTVRAIQTAIADYKRRMPGGPKVHVGDISKKGGGKFPPHVSHQHGRDVDVGYVLTGKDAHETRFRAANSRNLDVPRTWALIKAFIDTDEVAYIFMDYSIQKLLHDHAVEQGVREDVLDELFQYPRGRGRSHGIIRHWKGHVNHFHVRFRS